jgi:predicted DNA-binding transcriptional regulator AlpA
MSDNLGVCLEQIFVDVFEARIVKIIESTVQRLISRGQTADEETLLSDKDTAKFLRVSTSVRYRNGSEITIPFKKQDKVYFIKEEVMEWLAEKIPVSLAPIAQEGDQLLTNKPRHIRND